MYESKVTEKEEVAMRINELTDQILGLKDVIASNSPLHRVPKLASPDPSFLQEQPTINEPVEPSEHSSPFHEKSEFYSQLQKSQFSVISGKKRKGKKKLKKRRKKVI